MEISHNIVYTLRVLFFVAALLAVSYAFSAPEYEANAQGVKVTVYSEDCKLPEVKNLPKRATWEESGKVVEGCAGVHPMGVAMFWFADKTVVAIPTQAFKRITGA